MEGSHPHSHHHHLMLLKRKQMLRSHIESAAKSSSSWEERAFAEDAARILGGYVWPPRSYSCTFCKREFRSAQALGGHMNVHRRDRARLKQTQATCILLHHDCNNNKRSSDSEEVIVAANNNGRKQQQEDFAGFISHHHHHNNNHCYVETDLSMGLLPASSSPADEEALICKRPKISSSVQLPLFIKPFSNEHRGLVLQSAEMVIGVHSKPKMEDLDLELRLGKSH